MKKTILSVSAIVALQTANAQGPVPDWAKGAGSTSVDQANSTTVDAAGNTYTTGFFIGTVDFDPGPGVQNLTAIQEDVYVQKLDKYGNYVWAVSVSGPNIDHGESIELDPVSGDVYVTGYFMGTADFDPTVGGVQNLTALGGWDAFAWRIDEATGNYIWAVNVGVFGSEAYGLAVTTDAAGNAYVTGTFWGTIDFDPGPGLATLTSAGAPLTLDIFIQKFDPFGTLLWAKRLGGTSPDFVSEIVVDGSGNVITTGSFRGTADFNPDPILINNLVSAGINDIFISKLDLNGAYVWAKKMGNTGDDIGNSIAVDGSNNVYSCGKFSGTVNFNPNPGPATNLVATGIDGYIQKLDAAGTLVWAKGNIGAGTTECVGIDLDNSGNVFTTGSFSGTADFNPDPILINNLVSVGSNDIFVQQLDALTGAYLWAARYGATGSEVGVEISTWNPNEFFVCGYYQSSTVNFSNVGACKPAIVTLSGSSDAFVAKWKPLESNWHQQTNNTTASESGTGVITDLDGNVYVVGVFRSSTDMGGGFNPDITISSGMGTSDENTYAAKYDPCGNLIWVINTTNATDCQGATITFDRVNNWIYIGGTFNGNVTFNSSQSMAGLCTSGFSQPLSSPEPRGFVAQYDAITGCLNYVEALDFGIDTRLNALTINETTGHLFAGGSALAAGFTVENRAWVHKYLPSSTVLGATIWSLTDPTLTPLTFSVVNDLDYYESGSGRVVITGTFLKIQSFFNGATTSTVNTTSAISDAFMAVYRDVTPPSMLFHRAGGAVVGNYMAGEGICVDQFNGRVYFTGSYSGTITNPFGFGTSGAANLTGTGTNKAYMMSLKVTVPLAAWAMSTSSGIASGSSFGRDVVAHDQKVYFLGEFTNTSVTAPGYGLFAFVGGTAGGTARHVFVTGYTEATATIGMNVTQASTPTTPDTHTGVAIESDRNGYSYVTGQFSKQMHYLAGTPPSGPLVSANGQPNAYIMRVDESNTQFRNELVEAHEENAYVSAGASDQLSVFPNPTNGQVTIALSNFNPENKSYKLVIYNSLGKLIQTVNVTNEKTTVDLSGYENGIYLLNFNDGKTTSTVRISKTN